MHEFRFIISIFFPRVESLFREQHVEKANRLLLEDTHNKDTLLDLGIIDLRIIQFLLVNENGFIDFGFRYNDDWTC